MVKLSVSVTHEAVDARTALSVTADTPAHLHRGNPLDLLHLRNLSVTLLTRDSSLDVSFVIELGVVGEHVNLYPRDRLAALVVILELLDVFLTLLRLTCYQSSMATHAGFCLGYRGVSSLANGPVTILTLHLVLLDVDYVAEINWLLWLVSTRSLRWAKVMKMVSDV
jgi:hypothetical protein